MLYNKIQRKGKFIESCESSTTSNEMENSIEYLSILLYRSTSGEFKLLASIITKLAMPITDISDTMIAII